MIFVTVGTHEQQFNRLVKCVDGLKEVGKITEEVIIQTGFSTYKPKHCTWSKLYPYKDMIKYVNEARIIITHGGPSSFIMPLQIGKIPIVVPRSKDLDEHINNHQIIFCKAVEERCKNIIVVENTERLGEVIEKYDELITSMSNILDCNNVKFCTEFERIVAEIMK